MTPRPFQVVKDFESAVAEFCGSPYCVSTASCTAALMLAVAWHLRDERAYLFGPIRGEAARRRICMPKKSYIGVPMSIVNAGGWPVFRDEDWQGEYELQPLNVWDSARRFTSGMYRAGRMTCCSFHWSKTLGIQQGGCILLDDPKIDIWLRRARFDGRQEGVAPAQDTFDFVGFHEYMAPEVAAQGLVRLALLPRHNADLPRSDYSDLSLAPAFRARECVSIE